MNNNQQNLNVLAREQYSAPDYRRFTFETSGLAQMSGDAGNFGNAESDVSNAVGDSLNSDFDW